MPTLQDPTAFSLGPLDVRWYALFILIGIFAAIGLSYWLAQRRGLDGDFLLDMATPVVLLAIVGARVYYVLLRWDHFIDNLFHPNGAEGLQAFFDKRAPRFR